MTRHAKITHSELIAISVPLDAKIQTNAILSLPGGAAGATWPGLRALNNSETTRVLHPRPADILEQYLGPEQGRSRPMSEVAAGECP